MDLRRLRAGEWMAGLGGVVLLVSLFVPWYEPGGVSGWESLAALDVLLAFVAAAGVLLAVVTATQSVPAVPIALAAIVTLIGFVGVVLVVLRIADVPNELAGREWGVWLALAGALGILVGAVLAMREERRPGAEDSRVEFVPAPRP
jgi:peptidoglycan/LPS O-acetylase OafA/YrhL